LRSIRENGPNNYKDILMSEPESAVWRKIDANTQEIQELKVANQLNKKMIDNHTEEFRRVGIEQARQHTEIMTAVGEISTDVKTVSNDYHQRQGKAQITSWLIPTLLTSIGLLFGYITLMS